MNASVAGELLLSHMMPCNTIFHRREAVEDMPVVPQQLTYSYHLQPSIEWLYSALMQPDR
jgi:hypothetical protein